MLETYPVFILPPDTERSDEDMGTKPKFWFEHPGLGWCLYKQGHPGTGEDWAEKVAAELSELIGLPHANYELATWKDTLGVLSPSFNPEKGALVPGNEILFRQDESYPRQQRFRVRQHTIDTVFSALDSIENSIPFGWEPPPGIRTASDVFVGYLLLDAWIGNTDRHHENWAFIQPHQRGAYLAPTHDHAASLGAILRHEERQERLTTRDLNRTVTAYANKGRSALFADELAVKPLLIFEAFGLAAQRYNDAADIWINRLSQVSQELIQSVFQRLPQDRITVAAAEFAKMLLTINQQRLVKFQKELR